MSRRYDRLPLIVLVLALVAGPLALPSSALPAPPVGPRPGPVGSPQAVLGVVDTGINPYHQVFRDPSPRAYQHPSTYLPGYPVDAVRLDLTLDAVTWKDAVAADCDRVWKTVVPGKLYWVAGTKIVGAISFGPAATPNATCTTGVKILDLNGHGTMSASRAASLEYGACHECLVAAIQFPTSVPLVTPGASTGPTVAAIRWAASNAGWLDAQSNSWGPVVPAHDPTGTAGLLAGNPELNRAVDEVSKKHLAFFASGNGAAFRFGAVGHPTVLAPHLGPAPIIVGGHDSGYVNTWPGFSAHLVSDSCNSWAAFRDKIAESGDSVGGGTSAATPYAAGTAVRELLTARKVLGDTRTGIRDGVAAQGPAGLVPSGPLADGTFTVAEWREVLLKTATPRPVAQYEDGPACTVLGSQTYAATPVLWKDVPTSYPEYVQIGYGAADAPAFAVAERVLLGQTALPARPATDAYFAVDRQARETLQTVFTRP